MAQWKNWHNCIKYTVTEPDRDLFNPMLEITIGYFKLEKSIGFIIKKEGAEFNETFLEEPTPEGLEKLKSEIANNPLIPEEARTTLKDEDIKEVMPDNIRDLVFPPTKKTKPETSKSPKNPPKLS